MKKRTSLFLFVPLGAALLYLGSLAPLKPGAVVRPATSPDLPATTRSNNEKFDVADSVARIDYEPARGGFLETVVVHGSVGERKAAIRELRQIANDEAIRILSMALGDDDPRVEKAAFEALSSIGGDQALAAIASAMVDHDPRVRARAAEALAGTGGYSASDYLELALRDDDPRVRLTAIDALGDLNSPESVNIISVALRDSDPEVRARAAEMLEQLNDEALFHTLYPAM